MESGKAKIENGKARAMKLIGAKFDRENINGANKYF
jgi:hypothetical protein